MVAFYLAVAGGALAAENAEGRMDHTVTVATRIIEPFVFEEDGKLTGFSVDLWTKIAERAGIQSTFVVHKTIGEVLEAVKTSRNDAAIAAISISSERQKTFDFSIPMFDDGMGILIPADSSGDASVLSGLLASKEIRWLGLSLFLLVFIPAHFIWMIERKAGEDERFIAKSYVRGVFDGAFWVATALVGASDGMPTKPLSRVIAVTCCYLGLIFATFFTALATSTLTAQQMKSSIAGPEDLRGKVVATVAGSTEAAYLRTIGARSQEYPGFNEAVDALLNKKAVALVYDFPVLSYFASHGGSGKVLMVGDTFNRDYDGIVFRHDSAIRRDVDIALLALREDGSYKALYEKWFGR
jgi:polar amino acid transport system substrate-binding protein